MNAVEVLEQIKNIHASAIDPENVASVLAALLADLSPMLKPIELQKLIMLVGLLYQGQIPNSHSELQMPEIEEPGIERINLQSGNNYLH
ncbi:hypothetical protein SAMN06265795_13119 [Noviherbaspirillum humi]|uniref:Uncharacterized protein n=1 Tax=Noviherbaspirillum humi TaxID=1688639 RepID=A0A239M635_9BURK|nr:hypothetical protein [Noviherbaspirillum humi]SNT37504.1 hypothetical protein SAMN06265795_13119 [Noviherbaspirillum humi]